MYVCMPRMHVENNIHVYEFSTISTFKKTCFFLVYVYVRVCVSMYVYHICASVHR